MNRREAIKGAAALVVLGQPARGEDRRNFGEFCQRRECNAACCDDSPLVQVQGQSTRPDGQTCHYLDRTLPAGRQCKVMADFAVFAKLAPSLQQEFIFKCLAYPNVWYTGDTDGPRNDRCCMGERA